MSKWVDDSGLAFPSYNPSGDGYMQQGMSLRDWFAGQALVGIKSNPELCRICSNMAEQGGGKQQDYIAKMAYVDADAMLAARGGGK